MQTRFSGGIEAVDAAIVVGMLAFALIAPVFFMVPYNDEWIRMNYLADHTPWQWTVMHTETWVVRPTAEIIMSWISLANARRMLPQPLTAAEFLGRFHALYVVLALALLALVYALAAVIARSARCLPQFVLGCACVLICIAVSDELGYAFYWADGYANVVLPFVLMVIGLVLAVGSGWRRALGYALLLMAALGHEVLCIFACGFCVLQLLRVRGSAREYVLLGVLLAVLLVVLYAQGFSAGPAIRSQVFLQRSGVRYNWRGAWEGVKHIDPWRSLIAFAATLLAIASLRDRLGPSLARACEDARQRRAYWILLALGALVTCTLPIASVGLKKATIVIGAYSVATELFVILSAALAYPVLDGWLAPYCRRVGSVLPVVLVVVLTSPNLASFRAAVSDAPALRAAAHEYVQTLIDGRGQRVRVVRPCHPFIKPASGMSARNATQYFELAQLKEVNCHAAKP